MKLLFDENLSHRLCALLVDVFPGAAHVRDSGLQSADDATVWTWARQHGYTIVSKDEDFHQRSFLYGPPPKVVWVRVGNSSTAEIARLLRGFSSELRAFEANDQAAFLVLSRLP